MKTIIFDDRIGSRSIKHLNLLFGMYQEHQVIVEFKGQNIEGVCHVINETYNKNGKWSHSTWEVALPNDVEGFVLYEDWEMGKYFPQKTWEGVKTKIVDAMKSSNLCFSELDMACVKRFITAKFPTTAEECNVADQILKNLNSNFGELYEAQQALLAAQLDLERVKTAVQDLITARETRKQAESLRRKTGQIRTAMANGASLADLQAMFNS